MDRQYTDEEDWQKFLRELSQPLVDEKPDNIEEDPEYVPDERNSTMKVTRKELNALISKIFENEESFLNGYEECEKNEEDMSAGSETPSSSDVQPDIQTSIPGERAGWALTWEERLQLEQQMRRYVQLLTQSYLLSCGIPELNFLNISSKLFLDEIKMFASRGGTVNGCSAFYSHNLDGALDIVNDFENKKQCGQITMRSNQSFRNFPGIPLHQVKKIIFSSKVFLYPELLPTCGFSRNVENRKAIFIPAEDNLIALGLEEFSFSSSPVYYIRSFLVPSKTEEQIKIRIKNSKSIRGSSDNPIKYYFVHKKAPPFPRTIEILDPDKVKAPKDQPLECLPKWATRLFPPPSTKTSPILPKAPKPSLLSAKVLKPEQFRPRFRPILPRKRHHSPLKQISPILKKCNQKRFLPSDHSSKKNKAVHIVKKILI